MSELTPTGPWPEPDRVLGISLLDRPHASAPAPRPDGLWVATDAPPVADRPPSPADPSPAGPSPAGGPVRVQAWLGGVGKVLSVLGVLVLAFFAFQLWGTNVLENRSQRRLSDQFDRALQQQREAAAQGPAAPGAGGQPATVEPPVPGSPVARLRMPTLGVEETVVEGVGRVELRHGPGHNPGTPLPGHRGNVAIAGHRTTHGAPFADLDRLQPGDPIEVDTVDGRFTYHVVAQARPDGAIGGYQVVAPDDVAVIADQGDNRLTLTSCYPRYSDRQRLVVVALLDGAPVDPAPGPLGPFAGGAVDTAGPAPTALAGAPAAAVAGDGAPTAAIDSSRQLGWQWDQLGPTLAWALVAALTAALMVVVRRRPHRWAVWGIAPLLLLEIGIFFVHVDRMLPSF